MCNLLVLESRSLQSRWQSAGPHSLKALGEKPSLPLGAPGDHGVPGLVATSFQLPRPLAGGLSHCLSSHDVIVSCVSLGGLLVPRLSTVSGCVSVFPVENSISIGGLSKCFALSGVGGCQPVGGLNRRRGGGRRNSSPFSCLVDGSGSCHSIFSCPQPGIHVTVSPGPQAFERGLKRAASSLGCPACRYRSWGF